MNTNEEHRWRTQMKGTDEEIRCSDEEHRWRTHMKNTYEEYMHVWRAQFRAKLKKTDKEQRWKANMKSLDEECIWRAQVKSKNKVHRCSLFVFWGFSSDSRFFHLHIYGDVIFCGKGL